jgi:DNA-binding beta-propeller fold protein YncE
VKAAGSVFGALATIGVQALAGLAGAVVLGACATCESTVRQLALPSLAATPIDAVATDNASHRLYLADGAARGVDVVDISTTTPEFVRTIGVGYAPLGLAVAPDLHRLYAGLSNGGVAVIDTERGSPKFMQVITTIAAGTTVADLLDYNPARHQLLVATATDGQVVVVNAISNGISAVYPIGAPIGQARFNSGDGKVYVTVPSADAIYRIDQSSEKVTRKLVAKGCHPNGLAVNPSRNLAIVTCRGSVGLFDLETGGSTISRVVQGGDIVTYDSTADQFAVASPHDVHDSTIGVFAGDGTFIGAVTSSPYAHAAAFDTAHGLIYAAGASGLMTITPGACLPPPNWLKFVGGLSIFVVPLLAAALFLLWYARRPRDHASKRKPEPTYHDLQQEDLAFERERMRAFEDSVLGPQISPES